MADKTHTPVGFFFLPSTPEDKLPVLDFRTIEGEAPVRPSPDLLDTLYACQQRQDWFREYLVGQDADALLTIGSARITDPIPAVAQAIGAAISFDLEARATTATWEEALATMIEGAEDTGILVMRNGVVGNNTHRKLDVKEFRGFALSDSFAPLVFVNAADAKAGQMFTLAHELAHLWVGASGVSNWSLTANRPVEQFCNAVAAELLVPISAFLKAWNPNAEGLVEAKRLAKQFKTSSLVILIRAHEAGRITKANFDQLYALSLAEIRERPVSTGGDFYRTQNSRLGKRFARAVVSCALEGQMQYREAFQLLGLEEV